MIVSPYFSANSPRPYRNKLFTRSKEGILTIGKEVINLKADKAVFLDLLFYLSRILSRGNDHQSPRMGISRHLFGEMAIGRINIESPGRKREKQPACWTSIRHPLRKPFVIDRASHHLWTVRSENRSWVAKIRSPPEMGVCVKRIGWDKVREMTIPDIAIVVAYLSPLIGIHLTVSAHGVT